MGASYGKLMMWFFLMSDAFTFSGLLITYGLVRSSNPAYEGAVDAFHFATTHWPIPEKVFEAVPFLHGMTFGNTRWHFQPTRQQIVWTLFY